MAGQTRVVAWPDRSSTVDEAMGWQLVASIELCEPATALVSHMHVQGVGAMASYSTLHGQSNG